MVPLTDNVIQRGLRTNTGQCLPVNLMAQCYMDYIEENLLDPAQTAGWCFDSHVACNIRLYPQFIKGIMESNGKGMEKVDVYVGSLTLAIFPCRPPLTPTLLTCLGVCCVNRL